MLKDKMLEGLNNQTREELESFYIYLSMAGYFDSISLTGCGAWMKAQANEEMSHAMKFYGYINERDARVVFAGLNKPKADWKSPLEAFEDAYKHEQHISGCIHKLAKLAQEVDDPATLNFLQWFIKEQVEEESSTRDVVDKLRMIGEAPHAIFMMDRVLGERK